MVLVFSRCPSKRAGSPETMQDNWSNWDHMRCTRSHKRQHEPNETPRHSATHTPAWKQQRPTDRAGPPHLSPTTLSRHRRALPENPKGRHCKIPKGGISVDFRPSGFCDFNPTPSGDLSDQINSDPSALTLRARATAYTCTPLPAEHTAHRSEQGEPFILTNLSTMRQPVLGGQIMQLRDPSAPARWTADRACGAWARNP